MSARADILDQIAALKASGESFAVATVVRTLAATAAKPGAKAIIRPDGTVIEGWIGGGCARSAVLKAARESLADGQPRLVSIQPEDLLAEQGVTAGSEKAGIRFARNMCPSQGTMDVFVEPLLPLPELVICGASPVAVALAEIGPRFGFRCTICAPAADHGLFAAGERMVDGFAIEPDTRGQRFVVVSTQGRGDEAALRAAVTATSDYVAFVGSRAKARALRDSLAAAGVPADRLAALKAPAGLDIGAITPDEIALSILAEIVQRRRQGERAVETARAS